jgi:3-hydroxyacyl-CoA dehydrogenase
MKMNPDPHPLPVVPFARAAVLGAGTMGAQIAAHLANAGLHVELLDMKAKEGDPDALVAAALGRMKKLKPAPLFSDRILERIRVGNFDDHFDRLSEVDWVIEAVVERADIKQSLFQRLEAIMAPHTLVSSNTSGIPIATLAEGRSASFRARFMGTHFFNPPRYLELFELIPGPDTALEHVERVAEFARVHLGKGVVVAKDSPYFIGNRIGIYAMLLTMRERDEHGLSMEEVDQMSGELVGHPKSATYRTADVVGLDVMKAVISNLYEAVPADEERDVFQVSAELEDLVGRGHLGAKSKAGYYRKEDKDILSWDPLQVAYAKPRDPDMPKVKKLMKQPLAERLSTLFGMDNRTGDSFRRVTLPLLAYAARRIGEVTDEPLSVDRAIRWGFGWEMGPFEIWDAIGFETARKGMQQMGLQLPGWVLSLASDHAFYRPDAAYVPAEKTWTAIRIAADESVYQAHSEPIRKTDDTLLRRLTDDVALLEFRSKANTLGSDVIADLVHAIRHVEADRDLRGLVIGNTGTHFSVGANLLEVGTALLLRRFGKIEAAVAAFQDALEAVHKSRKPVVVAPHSLALGGATELTMANRTPVVAAESHLGLVELGVGLIPAGGGCLRLAEQAALSAPSDHPSEILARLQGAFKQVAMAEVSASAVHAKEMGYLAADAPVVLRSARRFHVAAERVRMLSEAGYQPLADAPTIHVLGRPGAAALESMAYQFHQGRFISDYDRHLAVTLAGVLTGGDLAGDVRVPRQHLLDLEREAFMSLLGEKKTRARIRHMLETRKPLRN